MSKKILLMLVLSVVAVGILLSYFYVLPLLKSNSDLAVETIKQNLVTAARQVFFKYQDQFALEIKRADSYHLPTCTISNIENERDFSNDRVLVTFRERHGRFDYVSGEKYQNGDGLVDCGGNPETTPRILSMKIDRQTGRVFTDISGAGWQEVNLDQAEKEAVAMSLADLKSKIDFFAKDDSTVGLTSDSEEFQKFYSYYWTYLRRAGEDKGWSVFTGRFGPCFGIPDGDCRE